MAFIDISYPPLESGHVIPSGNVMKGVTIPQTCFIFLYPRGMSGDLFSLKRSIR